VKYIFSQDIDKLLRTKKRIFLFLDFDGTLSPIVKNPDQAKLPKSSKALLKQLVKRKNLILGIISGRKLSDIRKRVGLKGIIYAGNHGLEMSFKARKKPLVLKSIKKGLSKAFKGVKGVILEDKGLVLAVHYRKVAANNVKKVKSAFYQIAAPWLKAKKIKLGKGKKVLEIKPNISFNKADALSLFQKKFKKQKGELTIFIGDDLTDEDIFKMLKKPDMAIRVGKTRASLAKYFLKDPQEVRKLLNYIAKTLAKTGLL
jgi:trehalose-phosphatase